MSRLELMSMIKTAICATSTLSSPSRLQLPQHGGVRGFCAFLRWDGWPLLALHGWSRSWRWVHLFPDPPKSLPFILLLFLSLPVPLVLPARNLSQSCHVQELEEVLGGVHGDSNVYRFHPGEGAAQTGPQRYWSDLCFIVWWCKCEFRESYGIFNFQVSLRWEHKSI